MHSGDAVAHPCGHGFDRYQTVRVSRVRMIEVLGDAENDLHSCRAGPSHKTNHATPAPSSDRRRAFRPRSFFDEEPSVFVEHSRPLSNLKCWRPGSHLGSGSTRDVSPTPCRNASRDSESRELHFGKFKRGEPPGQERGKGGNRPTVFVPISC
jgi:hypothetical protein